ncbi:hypothetical protein SAMN05216364_1002126 [Porphyromonadaceae bacterium KHP3R9]|nr:hypothetical protein SAMN05216364_1002126 [Porphyromonadaceae bacterium KHP3R9]
MKRAVGIGMLLVANMILLVHAFIPHHHHHLCSDSFTEFYHWNDPPRHCCHTDNKDEHHELSLVDCLLDNIVYLPSFQENVSGDDPADQERDTDFPTLCLTAVTSDCGEPLYGLPFRRKPQADPLFTNHNARIRGLRAPPAC